MGKKKIDVDEIKRKMRERKPVTEPDYAAGLSIGATLGNLALTGRANVGLPPGSYLHFVGTSDSGKTYVSLAILAEASINKRFAKYDLIYDGPEFGAQIDVPRHFGTALAERMRPPARNKDGSPRASRTVEEAYFFMDNDLKAGKPFVRVIDSMDGLTSEAEQDKFGERKSAWERGKETTGIYTDGKAKENSMDLRQCLAGLQATGSILVIVSQAKEKIGGFGYDKDAYAGGKALRYYCSAQIWSSVVSGIRKKIRGQDVQIGNLCRFKVKRSRFTGRHCAVDVPIYWSSGIDDLGSCIEYLIEWKHWTRNKEGTITATDFGFQGNQDALVQHIEGNNLEKSLRLLVSETWQEVEEAAAVQRKPRYV